MALSHSDEESKKTLDIILKSGNIIHGSLQSLHQHCINIFVTWQPNILPLCVPTCPIQSLSVVMISM